MSKRVLVFGSYVTDLSSRTEAFPKPGQTIKGFEFRAGPGGKGFNQAVAASRAGADVTFVTKLGDDFLGRETFRFCNTEALNSEHVIIQKGAQTGTALIMVDESTAQNQIVVVGGACEQITDEDVNKVSVLLDRADIFLTQLETNIEPVYDLLLQAKGKGIRTIVNPAPARHLKPEYMQYIDLLIPNEVEAEYLTGITVHDCESARQAVQKLLLLGVGGVIITLGKRGAFAFVNGEEKMIAATDCGTAVDTTGAGDAFIGGLVAALAKEMALFDAVDYGSVVAGIAVTRKGTAPAMPFQSEISRFYQASN